MEVGLTALSPMSFLAVKEGDSVKILHKPPRHNEYREKIGPAIEYYLVFRGQTKIGMIPSSFVNKNQSLMDKKVGRVVSMDKAKSSIVIDI
jgi:hypothetical protein